MQQHSNATTEAPLVIIGSGLAGYNLVKEIRRLDKSTPIVMYTADDGVFYSKPLLSTGFSANKTAADLGTDSAESMAQKTDIEINIFTRISAINVNEKTVTLEQGGTRAYSKLVLALGASCITPPLQGNGISKVHSVNDLLDYAKFRTLIKPQSKVLVIGAGLIGSEYADDLTRAGHKVSVVDPLPGALANLLPEQASNNLTDNLGDAGITFHLGTVVTSIDHHNNGIIATLKNGKKIEADIVLSAVGIRPNTALANKAGIQCERGIRVGRDLQTSSADVFAIGDCAEVKGHVLPYIAPLMLQAKALSKTLCGERTELSYGVLPVLVKTKLHPVVLHPPVNDEGSWQVDVNEKSGVKARCLDAEGNLTGYGLTGDQCRENAKLMRQCLPLMRQASD